MRRRSRRIVNSALEVHWQFSEEERAERGGSELQRQEKKVPSSPVSGGADQAEGSAKVRPIRPDPEVSAKPVRRSFTAEYKARILREADACAPGEIGALLRREGLYSSHLSKRRQQRERGVAQALAPAKRGPKKAPRNPPAQRVAELEQENRRLQQRLQQAEVIIEVQKKSPRYWGFQERTVRTTDRECQKAG